MHILASMPIESTWQSQPKTLCIHWWGRLDNHNDLQQLVGSTQTTAQDLVVALYKRYGKNCADKLRGDFAFAIWDPRHHAWFCARDAFGCQPFYYFHNSSQFCFAPTIPALLAQTGVPNQFDTQAIANLLGPERAFITPYTDQTYHQHILRLTPGHTLWVTQKTITKTAYWQLDPHRPSLHFQDDNECLEAFTEKLHHAVNVRLNTTGTTGIESSAGIDSSLILSTASQHTQSLEAFTHIKGNQDTILDEQTCAIAINKALGIDTHHLVNANDLDVIQALQFCAQSFAGPMPYLFNYGAQAIHQAVQARNIPVLLSGHGGDECVNSLAFPFLTQVIKEQGTHAGVEMIRAVAAARGTSPPSHLKAWLLTMRKRAQISGIWPAGKSLKFSKKTCFLAAPWRHYVPKSMTHRAPIFHSIPEWEAYMLTGAGSHRLRMRIEYSAILAQARGIEYRYPLLDRDLVEFCFALPLKYKYRDGRTRYLGRTILKQNLPEIPYPQDKPTGAIYPGAYQKLLRFLNDPRNRALFENLPFIDTNRPTTTQALHHRKAFSTVLGYIIQQAQKK